MSDLSAPDFDRIGAAAVQQRLRERLAPHTDPTGALQVPHTCRLFWGRR